VSTGLFIDFGSTYTKLRAVDLDAGAVIATAQGPSTVTTDVNVGLDAALAQLAQHADALPRFACRLASSSAAGGLRMVTAGLVRELTAEAARQAALGAGARLVGSFAYRLTAGDVARVVELVPDILLLCGGTDGGNASVIVHNATLLAQSPLACPVVVAGNREAADECARLLREGARGAGRRVVVTANVMPQLNVLDIEPARAAIRVVFLGHIVHAKGIDRAAARFDAVLMPTPAAVLEGARLLADGTGDEPGLGPLVVVDPGGATTDVHSIGEGADAPGVIRHGLPEPYAKRTVEGDLGMRHNAAAIAAAAGLDALARDAGITLAAAESLLATFTHDVGRLPQDDAERRFDAAMARAAIRLAMARHAGTHETVYTAQGPVSVQRGKDLREAAVLIGTGGALVHAGDPAALLAAALADAAAPQSLRPRAPKLLLDRDYLLYAVGLLAQVDAPAALRLGRARLASCAPA
jgi:uncharacterized protein (TIGR01319 family)